MTELTTHLRPETIAQLIAELIADHAAEYDTGESRSIPDARSSSSSSPSAKPVSISGSTLLIKICSTS